MKYILTLALVCATSLSVTAQNDRITSVFKFYSNDNCRLYKEGKMVCSIEGNSDEPYYLPVTRKGEYRFKAVNTATNETKVINERIDADEERNIDIEWSGRRQPVMEQKASKPVAKQESRPTVAPVSVPQTKNTSKVGVANEAPRLASNTNARNEVPRSVSAANNEPVRPVPAAKNEPARSVSVAASNELPRSVNVPATNNAAPKPVSASGLTALADSAYYQDMEVTSIFIPASMEKIGLHTVDHCFKLTEFQVDVDNPYFKAINGVIYSKDGSTLVLCPPGKEGEFVIPSTVKKISPYAFSSCKKITSIVLPEGLVEIPDGAFYKCWGLEKINLPDGLKRIGKNAFDGTIIQKMNMPTSMEYIDDEAFVNTSLVEVNLRVTTPFELGDNVFGEIHVTRLNVPSAGLSKFQQHPKWGKFGRITPTHSYWTVDLP